MLALAVGNMNVERKRCVDRQYQCATRSKYKLKELNQNHAGNDQRHAAQAPRGDWVLLQHKNVEMFKHHGDDHLSRNDKREGEAWTQFWKRQNNHGDIEGAKNSAKPCVRWRGSESGQGDALTR